MVEFVKPTQPRFKILDTPDGIDFVIPAKIDADRKVVFIVMVGAATLIFFVTLLEDGFAVRSLLFWFAWVCIVFLLGLWPRTGLERIRITPTQLIVRQERFGFHRSESYELFVIENLRVALQPTNKHDSGTISFDYGEFTIRFGNDMEEAEAKQIIERLGSAIEKVTHDNDRDSQTD